MKLDKNFAHRFVIHAGWRRAIFLCQVHGDYYTGYILFKRNGIFSGRGSSHGSKDLTLLLAEAAVILVNMSLIDQLRCFRLWWVEGRDRVRGESRDTN